MSSKSNSPVFDEKVPLVTRVVVNLLAIFYGFLVSCYLTFSIIKNRSTYFHTKRRDVPPNCLKDPALGTHHFIQLKVLENYLKNRFIYKLNLYFIMTSLKGHKNAFRVKRR